MAENSKIEWCDSTFNPWIGCTNVGPGCDHCYAEALMDKRWRRVQWGIGKPRERTSAANWKQPLLWEKEHEAFALMHGRRRRVFCASLADVFDNQVPADWRVDLFNLIAATPHLDWLLLTKRIGNVRALLADMSPAQLPANVWLGVTVVNHSEYIRDVHKLLAVEASVRFLSVEPMIGPISTTLTTLRRLDWVICGGESGPKARPMQREWARSLRDQCESAGVPFLFKQWGEWRPTITGEGAIGAQIKWADGSVSIRAGKKLAGRRLDGLTHDQFPESV